MVLKIEIETRDRELLANFPEHGESIELGDNIRVESQGVIVRKGFEFPSVIELVVYIGGGIGTQLAASVLYDWLRSSFKGAVRQSSLLRLRSTLTTRGT